MRIKFFFGNLIITFLVEGMVIISLFLIYRIVAQGYGAQGVGEYSLIKRVVGFLQPIFLLGIGVALPRYIALARDNQERYGYAQSGLFLIVALSFILLLFANAFKELFSQLFFGSGDYARLVVPFSFLFAGLMLHGFIYAYLRGRMFAKRFNFLQLINISIIPITIFVFAHHYSLESAVSGVGIATGIIAVIVLIVSAKGILTPVKNFVESLKMLIIYGLPRLPGDFAIAGLFSIPIIAIAHFLSIEYAGYLAIGQNIIQVIGAMFAPLGILLLPKVSDLAARGKKEMIQDNLGLLIHALIDVALFVSVQLLIFMDIIIIFWLGPEFIQASFLARIMVVSVIFYVFYVSVRSIIDAMKIEPINTTNSLLSLFIAITAGVLLSLFGFMPLIINFTVAFTIGLVCLGILTYNSLQKIYYQSTFKILKYLVSSFALNSIFAVIALGFKPLITGNIWQVASFLFFAGSLYLLIIWCIKRDWIRRGPNLIFLDTINRQPIK